MSGFAMKVMAVVVAAGLWSGSAWAKKVTVPPSNPPAQQPSSGGAPVQDLNGGPVYGASASLSGSRMVGNPGLVSTDADWSDAIVSWVIENNGDGTWDYLYTLECFDRPGISHVTLDFSNDAFDPSGNPLPGVITNAKFNGQNTNLIEGGNKDGMIGSIKFDVGADGDALTYSFTSNRAPVWGDLLVKGGSDGFLYNSGFTDHSLSDAGHFIARPNGAGHVVPLPASAWGGLGLLAGLGVHYVRKARGARAL